MDRFFINSETKSEIALFENQNFQTPDLGIMTVASARRKAVHLGRTGELGAPRDVRIAFMMQSCFTSGFAQVAPFPVILAAT
jgi:hypothetical protein